MRVYWDTSAAINALVSAKVWDRLAVGEHFTRPHMLMEFFSTMTGRGISVLDAKGQPARFCMTGNDAAAWLRKFCEQVRSVDLDLNQTLDALDKAQGANVTGGRVYDYGHGLAAGLAQADVILTRNTSDFQDLKGAARLEWP